MTIKMIKFGPERLYALLAAILVAVITLVFLEPVAVVSYVRDIWHHLSVYRELIASPFDAVNPHVATDDPSRSYAPWTIFIALLARLGGLDQFGAIALSAIGSTILILTGVYLFAREYWKQDIAPLFFLIILFGTWLDQVDHTGYTTLTTSLFSIAYPYASVLGMGFICWWLALRSLRANDRIWLYAIGLATLAFLMFTSHQLQAVFGIGMTGAFLLFAPGQSDWKRRLILCTSLMVGLIATRWWWYFDPIAYVLNPTVQGGHDAVRFLRYSLSDIGAIFLTLGLAPLGLMGFISWSNYRLRWDLAIPFIAMAGVFLVLLIKDNWVSVRILPFVVLTLQLGLVSFVLGSERSIIAVKGRMYMRFLILGTVLTAAFIAGTKYNRAQIFLETGIIPNQPRTWSSGIVAASEFAETLVPKGSIAIAQGPTAFPIEATSLSVVAIPRLFAEVPDMLERQADNRMFFAPETDILTRCNILQKYEVSLIVWRDIWLEKAVESELLRLGERKRFADLSFIAIGPDGFSACGGSE